mmetsp:Transcript_21207/g.73016  ORF Transcript_21207/g.73016 Transcript_21207/m.73016 type:complete len:457 (+) Transcript_21207:1-1371(+)
MRAPRRLPHRPAPLPSLGAASTMAPRGAGDTVPEDDVLPPELEAVLPPEPPPESKAHSSVIFYDATRGGGSRCIFKSPDGSTWTCQTTVIACGGSISAAMRLAKVLYQLVVDGASKEEALQFRQTYYHAVNSAVGHQPNQGRKTAAAPKKAPKKVETSTAGQSAHPVATASKKAPKQVETSSAGESAQQVANALAPVAEEAPVALEATPQRVEDEVAALKLLDPVPEGSNAFAHVKWNGHISGDLYFFYYQFPSGEKTRFQAVAKACRGMNNVCKHIVALCYTRFEAGDTKDEVTAFRNSLYEKLGGEFRKQAVKQGSSGDLAAALVPKRKKTGEEKTLKETRGRPRKKPKEGEDSTTAKTDERQSSSSSSGSTSSSSDDESKARSSGAVGAAEGGGQAAAQSAAAPSADAFGQLLAEHTSNGKACAKMLVRSGLRCCCHFMLAAECRLQARALRA